MCEAGDHGTGKALAADLGAYNGKIL